jgi:recombination protein RecA
VVKNKVAPPFRTAEFDIMFNEGISKSGDILDLATKLEVIQKRGAFFSFGDQRLGQGRENAKDYLRANPQVAAEIENEVRRKAYSGEVSLPLDLGAEGGEGEAAAATTDEEV